MEYIIKPKATLTNSKQGYLIYWNEYGRRMQKLFKFNKKHTELEKAKEFINTEFRGEYINKIH